MKMEGPGSDRAIDIVIHDYDKQQGLGGKQVAAFSASVNTILIDTCDGRAKKRVATTNGTTANDAGWCY